MPTLSSCYIPPNFPRVKRHHSARPLDAESYSLPPSVEAHARVIILDAGFRQKLPEVSEPLDLQRLSQRSHQDFPLFGEIKARLSFQDVVRPRRGAALFESLNSTTARNSDKFHLGNFEFLSSNHTF